MSFAVEHSFFLMILCRTHFFFGISFFCYTHILYSCVLFRADTRNIFTFIHCFGFFYCLIMYLQKILYFFFIIRNNLPKLEIQQRNKTVKIELSWFCLYIHNAHLNFMTFCQTIMFAPILFVWIF